MPHVPGMPPQPRQQRLLSRHPMFSPLLLVLLSVGEESHRNLLRVVYNALLSNISAIAPAVLTNVRDISSASQCLS